MSPDMEDAEYPRSDIPIPSGKLERFEYINMRLNAREIDELERFFIVNEDTISTIVRNALSNHLFIKESEQIGEEFILRRENGKFHRVRFT